MVGLSKFQCSARGGLFFSDFFFILLSLFRNADVSPLTFKSWRASIEIMRPCRKRLETFYASKIIFKLDI